MTLHFISTGDKFPYPYYIGVKTALKHCKEDIVLHILEEPKSEYFELLKKEPRLKIKPISIDKTLPVFKMDFYDKNSIANMKRNWKKVMMFDYLIWKTVSKEGGVIMGLDSITLEDWQDLLPNNKEMLVPVKEDKTYLMHGVMVKRGSSLAKKIMKDIEQVAQGKDIQGKHRAIIDGKYCWGGVGMVPFVNQVLENEDKVELVDLSKKTVPMIASSYYGFDKTDEYFVAYSQHQYATLIRIALDKSEWDPFDKVNNTKRKLVFHIPGLVHLPCKKEYMGCAFTQKILNLVKMLKSLGHTVYFYGAEGSDLPADEIIITHTLKDIRQEWGEEDNRFEIGYNWREKNFKHDINQKKTETTLKFYQNTINEINKRKKPDHFILLPQGYYHKPIADAVGLYLTCEPGIGYRGSYSPFRAFESSYIQNFTYGSEHPRQSINGNYYDRVIPNYFDPDDFEYSDKKEDYYLYIGRMILRKGVWTAVKATQAVGAKLILAGQQDPEIDIKKLPDNCEFIGYADIEKRKELMSKAIATFVPTTYLEPFAGTHIESMLHGTPPITTNFGVFPETIPDVLNGKIGFRCNTLQDFVEATQKAKQVNHKEVREYGERFLMDNVKWQFDKWFKDLYQLYLSTTNSNIKGWHYIK
jgi:glycosyltransferase involved in cell wall biosynthesis